MNHDVELRSSFRMWAMDSVALGHKLNPLAVTLLDRLTAQGLFEAAVLAVQLFEETWLPDASSQVSSAPEPDHVHQPAWRPRPGMVEEQIQIQVGLWIDQTRAMAHARRRGGTGVEVAMAYALEQAARLVSLRLVGFVLLAPSISPMRRAELAWTPPAFDTVKSRT